MYTSEDRTEGTVVSTMSAKLALVSSAAMVVVLGMIPGILTHVTDAAAITLLP